MKWIWRRRPKVSFVLGEVYEIKDRGWRQPIRLTGMSMHTHSGEIQLTFRSLGPELRDPNVE